jgi:hypothetical protein
MSGDSKHINNNSSINLQHQNHNITNIENVGSLIAASSPKVKKAQTNYKRNAVLQVYTTVIIYMFAVT